MGRTPGSARQVAAEAAIAQVCASGLPALELFEGVAERLRRVVPYSAGCWKPTDPSTLLFTGFAIEDPEPGALRAVRWRFVDNELLEPDFAKFARLSRSPRPVTTLHAETQGEPERSARYRKIHRALGFGAELRAVFRTGTACWGSVALVRSEGQPDFSRADVAFVERVAGHVALGLRMALLGPVAETSKGGGAPGIIVMDDELAIESLTAQARWWLEQFPADRGTGLELPAAVCAVARRARRAPDCERPAAGTVRLASGRWLTVQGARLEAARGAARIAVILAAAEPAEVLPLELELHGLTEREREVTRLLARGWSTKQIARGLSITHHTVKDHTKAIYAKLEVTSRAELTAKLFYEHPAPSPVPGAVREFAPAE
jgi:DNA-binding CsgD family transcriptional regulator